MKAKKKRARNMKKIIFLVIMLCVEPVLAQTPNNNETVVILHGIALTSKSMASVEKALQKEGYNTLNITYPSQKKNLEDLAQFLKKNKLTDDFWNGTNKVHFVTHSMGGIVTRTYLDAYKKEIPKNKLGRVVMLAPPNKGSEITDLIHKFPPYQWYYGPAGQELTTEIQKKKIVAPYYDLGIIAGSKEWPYLISAFITPGKSDGRVTVESTKLKGMKDHVVLSATHTFIMKKTEIHKQIIHFIKNGVFIHEK